MNKPGRSADLPGRESRRWSGRIPHGSWDGGIIDKGEPPVRVDDERCSPLVVSFAKPYIVIEPIVRGALIELFDAPNNEF